MLHQRTKKSWWLSLAAALLMGGALPPQGYAEDTVPSSNYLPVRGEQFFLLADSSFGSDQEARVRLEAQGRSYARFMTESYGGIDVRVYRIEKPLDFLKAQKNLHRVQAEGRFTGEGLSNTLAYLWDNWYRKSRRAMQRAFSYDARQAVTEQAPALRMGDAIAAPTRFTEQPRFDRIPGLPVVAEFRYPVWDAKPIQPPADVKMEGSSSNFNLPGEGNVYVPLGKLRPGLYLVESFVGDFRAVTVLFVSDTVAVSKAAGNELLVWTAHRRDGKAVPNAKVLWTDGLGVLKSGATGSDGVLRLAHSSPERSYVIGEDAEGGVFVSENFYYDSEIYDTKLYAFTDRPLYRPGDFVEVKITGRRFTSARESVAPAAAPIALTVIDANGTALQTLPLNLDPKAGAAARFQLPDSATAGGYELRFTYQEQTYSSAFRVAEYIKPHFEIALDLKKPDYRTGEAVEGALTLLYPDGRPVANANVQLTLRAQQLSMVNNELQYLGQFPVQLTATDLVTDHEGKAAVTLPAADKPSRYLLTVFASDGAAYRVKTSKEILIERGATSYRVEAAQRFSAANDEVRFRVTPEGAGDRKPARYEWVRLEDRSTGGAEIAGDTQEFTVRFAQPGSYNLTLKDAHGLILGATGHSVSGPGVKATPGSIEIVFDKPEYQGGDEAQALITFPEPVSEALLTLERDQVEATALLSAGGQWLRLERLNDTQYRAHIPVGAQFAPNITFSVLYTRSGDYSFQNAGIKVTVPAIAVGIKTDREVYRPGDTVTVELETTLAGKPQSAHLTVSVVDEMIYALQPEIAPTIGDFFWHPRRNNVRTSASLSFISYDVAVSAAAAAPGHGNRSDRGVKVLERPRREEKDTAAWEPDLVTGPDGKARFTFTVPDSLTRWRITARAIDGDGVVGQRRQFLRSEKPLYLKWSGPQRFRTGDQPSLGLLAFNQGSGAADAELVTTIAGRERRQKVHLEKGVNFLPLMAGAVAAGELGARLEQSGAVVDALAVQIRTVGNGWQAVQSQGLTVTARSTPLSLPPDARNLEVKLADGPDALFRSALDDLVAYPYGCVEQTGSRLLPLSLAYPQLAKGGPKLGERLRRMVQDNRMRLIQMAGPKAAFSWWGVGQEDAFLTAYAYYADWHASRALGLDLPDDHWQRVLEVYSNHAQTTPLLHRALILDFAKEMNLPVATLLQGLMSDLAKAGEGPPSPREQSQEGSLVLGAPESRLGLAAARVITARLAAAANVVPPSTFAALQGRAEQRLEGSALPFIEAVKLYRRPIDPTRAAALFQRLAPTQPTLERALILTWLHRAAAQTPRGEAAIPVAAWQSLIEPTGEQRWRWSDNTLPQALELQADPARPVAARVSFESELRAASTVPVEITRTLWKLVPGEGQLTYRLEDASGPLQSDALYLDEVVLTSTADKPLRYGLVEVPLPPGAEVERTTWGIQLTTGEGEEAAALEKATHEPGELRYALPVDTLGEELRFRHLVRFSQKGRFQLPPVRYFRMYAPEEQAWEAKPGLQRVVVE